MPDIVLPLEDCHKLLRDTAASLTSTHLTVGWTGLSSSPFCKYRELGSSSYWHHTSTLACPLFLALGPFSKVTCWMSWLFLFAVGMSFFKVPGAILAVCGTLASELNPESGECTLYHFFLFTGLVPSASSPIMLCPFLPVHVGRTVALLGYGPCPLPGSSPVMLYCDLTLVLGLAATGEVSVYIYFAMERLLHHLHKNDGFK